MQCYRQYLPCTQVPERLVRHRCCGLLGWLVPTGPQGVSPKYFTLALTLSLILSHNVKTAGTGAGTGEAHRCFQFVDLRSDAHVLHEANTGFKRRRVL